MGRDGIVKNSTQVMRDLNRSFFSSIHRVRVTDVHLEKGTVSVSFESLPYEREVVIPLLGLSMPLAASATDKTYQLKTSWGRYIPQVGDLLLVGFDANGACYSLGYHAVFYEGFKQIDDERESRGGIGWGEGSGKTLAPGDWDFKSSRNSSLYMGDKAKIASGPHSIVLDKTDGTVTTTSSLVQEKYGVGGQVRRGGARRALTPVSPTETYLFSLLPGNQLNPAQESSDVVSYGTLVGQVEVSRIAQGEVIDEDTKTPMVPAISPTLAPLRQLVGPSVRHLRSSKDPTGLVNLWVEAVDSLGNYGVSAPTATAFQWVSPLAVWNVLNLSTAFVSSSAYSVTSPTITLTGAASLALTGGVVSVTGMTSASFVAPVMTLAGATSLAMTGGAASLAGTVSLLLSAPIVSLSGNVSIATLGGLPLVLLTPALAAAWATYFTGAAAAWTALNGALPNPAFTTASAAAAAMAGLLTPTTQMTGL